MMQAITAKLKNGAKAVFEDFNTFVDDFFKWIKELLRKDKIEFIKGFNKERILKIPKGMRPDPREYLSKLYVSKHLSKFDNGMSYLVKESTLTTYGKEIIGMPDNTQFVMPIDEMDELLVKSVGNISVLEKELGIPAGYWHGESLIRIDVQKSSNIRIPSGNEMGANLQWIPGGKLPNGYSEAVIDNIERANYKETKIF